MADGIWLRLRFSGLQSKFFQAAQEASVRARALRAEGEAIDFELPVEDVMRLRRTLRRRDGTLQLLGHGGWPLVLRALRRRPWRLGLPLLAAAAYIGASSFVWHVQVEGPKGLPVQKILAAARRDGLAAGRPRFALRPRALGLEIQSQVGGLIFCAVRIDGVRAYIYAAPELPPPPAPPQDVQGPLMADQIGYVTRVVVQRGIPAVKRGETVLPGQPLILPRDGAARGEVYARVWRTFSYELPLRVRRLFATGRQAQRWYIVLPWGRQWTPQGRLAPYRHYSVQERSWRIPWLSVEFTRRTYVELRPVTLVARPRYIEAQAEEMAIAALRRAMPKAQVLLVRQEDTRQGTSLVVRVRVEAETDIARAATGGTTQD